ncbi:YnfC family lipoprotein [Pseudocitrobacter cyperus]|uniref:YnfC family lipoprotein n=1 Tax=Pseudocitrobacter cyperus TaxID=3112843 RepID=A0ABV0HLH7_9ENTR
MILIKRDLLFGFFVVSTSVLASNSYVPVLYNFSLLYGFMPVAGAVKNLNVVIENDKGKMVYELEASLNESGCIDSMQFNDVRKKSELILKRDGRSLKGVKDWSIIVITLDEKCNIVSKTENGGFEEYNTGENGLLTATRFMGNKVSEYAYDASGRMTMTKFFSSRGVTATNVVTYSDPEHKPLDYKLINRSQYSENYTSESLCKYDKQGTPSSCDVTITYDDHPARKPLRLKVMTKATFY